MVLKIKCTQVVVLDANEFSSAFRIQKNLDQLQPTQLVHGCHFGSRVLNLSQSSLLQVSEGNLLRSMSEVIGLLWILEKSLLNDIIGFNYIITALKVWG